MRRNPLRQRCCILLALLGASIVPGCATYQGPRIDPTGESLFVWPNQAPAPAPVVAGPPVAAPPGTFVTTPGPPVTTPVPPPAAPVVVAPLVAQNVPRMVPSTPFGNVVAPPVYSDPPGAVPVTPLVGPGPGVPVASVPLPPPPAGAPVATAPPIAAAPVPILPPPPGVVAIPVYPTAAVAQCGREFLRVSPEGLVAAVGSEMILKAAIVEPQRQLAAGERVDWSINRTGVGQFTELGVRESGHLLSFFEAPQRIDDWTATTTTARIPIVLNASTPDGCDDVPIYRGESWVTLTSPVEGTSIVTACAPDYEAFNQATSTIYWVDAQWVFPQPTVVEPGRTHTLTTTVMRRTDGAPLAGWIVRYDVSGGAIGYEGGSSVESTTDAGGRASVEVTPRDPGGGVTNVGITVIRPETARPAVMPRLQLGRVATTITWAAGIPAIPATPAAPGAAATPLPLPAPPGTFAPPASQPPALPPITSQPAPGSTEPPPTTPTPNGPTPNAAAPPPAATGTPRLEAALRVVGTDQVSVGDFVEFELTITNRGDGVARNVAVTDKFGPGLSNEADQANKHEIGAAGISDIAPGESRTMKLPRFRVLDGGTQCHTATITADGAQPVTQQGCVNARQADLTVNIDGPRRSTVGELADFNAVVKNVGDVPATNIELAITCDPAIEPTATEEGHQAITNGVLFKIDRLEPGERRAFRFQGRCRTASNRACARARVTSSGVDQVSEKCTEILPPLPVGSQPGTTPGTATPPAPSGLQLSIAVGRNPARVGEKQIITITVANNGQQNESEVAMRLILPAQLTVDTTQIQPQTEAQVFGQEIRFNPVADFPAGNQKQYIIPVTPNSIGQAQITAQLAAKSLGQPSTVNSELITITAASP